MSHTTSESAFPESRRTGVKGRIAGKETEETPTRSGVGGREKGERVEVIQRRKG